MKIKSIIDNVVVEELVEAEKKSKAGLIIPSNVINQPHKIGTVISVGNLVDCIKPGDIVAYAKHGGQVMALDQEKIIKVLKLGEIFCVLEPDDICECSGCELSCGAKEQ